MSGSGIDLSAMFQSLRSRLVLTTLTITLLAFAIVVFVFLQALPILSSQEKQRELQDQAHRFAAAVHTQIYEKQGTAADLRNQLYLASVYLHERIIIASPSGKRAIFDSARATQFFKGYNPDLSSQGLNGGQSISQVLPNNVVVVTSPIRGTHGHTNGGVVLVVARAADLRPNFSSLVTVGLIAAGAALIVWLLLALYFASSIFRPLFRVTQATRRMAQGDYSTRVEVHGRGELAQLAHGFNEMAQQVQAGDRSMKDFLANVSHDLRTPLTMIAGFSEAMLDGTAGPKEVEMSAGVIHDEAVKMQHLVDDLTQLTRLESGLLKLDQQPTDLSVLAQDGIDHVRRAHAGQDLPDLVNRVSPRAHWGLIDAERIERVLRNLLDNAIRYTPSGGTITIESRQAGRMVEISVRDTGSGIAPEDLSRVFERFYRADKSRGRAEGHSGLGLAIAREIVEAHGGRLHAESEPGKGTTFRLTIPAAQNPDVQPVAAPVSTTMTAP